MTENEMIEACTIAYQYNLDGAYLLDLTRVSMCNGIGPSSFPSWLRKAIDMLHPSLKVPANIHDIRYGTGDGTEEDWKDANEQFRKNGILIANKKYGWYNPCRYLVRHSANKFADLCNTKAGWLAYKSACQA